MFRNVPSANATEFPRDGISALGIRVLVRLEIAASVVDCNIWFVNREENRPGTGAGTTTIGAWSISISHDLEGSAYQKQIADWSGIAGMETLICPQLQRPSTMATVMTRATCGGWKDGYGMNG